MITFIFVVNTYCKDHTHKRDKTSDMEHVFEQCNFSILVTFLICNSYCILRTILLDFTYCFISDL